MHKSTPTSQSLYIGIISDIIFRVKQFSALHEIYFTPEPQRRLPAGWPLDALRCRGWPCAGGGC